MSEETSLLFSLIALVLSIFAYIQICKIEKTIKFFKSKPKEEKQ